ncbi:MAG TPA: condensation domain-containing protein, partial [Longimicrobiaceae bacterium]
GEEFPLGPGDRVLQKTSFSFDASVWELWAPLLSGAELVLAAPGAQRDPAQLVRTMGEEGVTTVQFVPTQLQVLLEEPGFGELRGVRRIFCGGEAFPAGAAARAGVLTGAEVVNLYGPTEACIDATWHVPTGGETRATLPIGRPVANVRAYVLERGGAPAPVGVPGELYLAGAQLARGYLGRAELTAERFVPDPFGGEAGARLYRTGDRARWLAEGRLEYLGRADEQVKLRGFRVEPGEVEAALLEHPAVREAVVVVREDAPGEKRLVAYVVAGAGEAPAPAELRGWLRERLPEHLVPSAVVALDALPRTPAGKLARRALPAPDRAAGDEAAYVEPRTPTERAVAEIWSDVLGAARVGAGDGFFELGGHSLLGTRVVSRVRQALGVEVPLRTVFEATTLAAFAARVDAAAGQGVRSAPVERVPRGERLPLSFAQQRLWLLDRLEPGSSAYNVPVAVRLRGALEVETLARALSEVVRRHEVLRTVFAEADGEPVQTVRAPEPVRIEVVDLPGLPEAELRRLARAEAARPFDLARGPLLRARLLRTGGEEAVALFTMHHVVSDAWSAAVLVREVSALYDAFSRGEPSPLPDLPVQYADYALWQRRTLSGEALEAQLAFWRGRLAGAPPLLELPTDRPRPAVAAPRAGVRRFALSPGTAAAVHALARAAGTTPFAALLAGWQALLARWSGQDDVLVGTPVANRGRAELEGLIGFFMNTLVLRADLSDDPTGRELLARTRAAVVEAQENQDLPFERLVEELGVERSLRDTPLFQVLFTVQDTRMEAELRLGGVQAEPLETGTGEAKFDLTLGMGDDGERIAGTAEFRAELFDDATVERLLEHYAAMLAGIAADPERRVSEIELLGEAERRLVVEEWNDTAAEGPDAACAHHLVEAQAGRTPDAVAVSWEGGALTYAELELRAGRLAGRLRALGVGPDARVGLCLERGPEMMVGVLGILKAGAAYVPLDPRYPDERLAYMLAGSGARAVVAEPGVAERLPEFEGEVVPVDGEAPAEAPEPSVSPDNLAYVIYTSGSTGTPKGVAMPHRPLVSLVAWQLRAARLPAAATLQFASLSFDVSFQEIFSTWAAGGRLVLVDEERRRDPAALLELLDREGVERIFLPFVALQQLAEEAERRGARPRALREVVTAGEQLR